MAVKRGQLLTQRAAAKELNVSERTLRRWALQHLGPPTLTIGKRRWYAREVLAQWLKARSYV